MNDLVANPHCVGFPFINNDERFEVAIVVTSHLDKHGERFSKKAVVDVVKQIKNKLLPMRFNHDETAGDQGAVLSAVDFKLNDGEIAVGIVAVHFDNDEQRQKYKIGEINPYFDQYKELINVDLLSALNDMKMLLNEPENMGIREALNAYLNSHYLDDNGKETVRKYNVCNIGDFSIDIFPGDHQPAHFHVLSKQRGINARISVDNLDLISIKAGERKISKRDLKLIKRFFQSQPGQYDKLKRDTSAFTVTR